MEAQQPPLLLKEWKEIMLFLMLIFVGKYSWVVEKKEKEQETEALSRGADCTLYAAEIAERRRRQIVMGQALMNLSNQIKANSAAIGQSVDTSGLKDYSKVGQHGFLKSQTVSGSNRLCYYDVLGSVKVLNVPSVKICPISHRF